jgi:hypothetical protein
MTIPNPSFETAGASPGLANQWTLATVASYGLIADFAEGGIPKPVEDFTGASWGTVPYVYTASGSAVVFDANDAPQPSNAETFVRWSFNIGYQTEVSGGVAVVFDGGAQAETFTAADWGTDQYELELSDPPTELETFDGAGWGSDLTTIVVPTNGTTIDYFDQLTSDVEDFEEVEPDVLFFVDDAATGLCAVPSGVHAKSNGDRVTVTTTGTRPEGLAANAPYFVIVVSATTFRLSKTNGGPAITFDDLGSGSHYLHADERDFWTLTE